MTSLERKQRISGLKAKAAEELRLFWAIAIYLALMLGAFTWYRRFILSESGLSYLHYGAAAIEAMILAKIILLGRAVGLGRRAERAPLLVSVVIKSVVFALFAGLFFAVEHVIEGLVHRESWHTIVQGLASVGVDEILARTVMVIVAFIPFFAFWETERVLGEGTLSELFFRRRAS